MYSTVISLSQIDLCFHQPAGMLPSQYINYSVFSGIGNIGHGYIAQGYLWCTCMRYMSSNTCCYIPINNRRAYVEKVGRSAQHSMQAAVEEVQTLPEYSTKGKVELLSQNMLCVLCLILANSGSSLMLSTILLQMPIIPLCPAFLESIALATIS